MPFVSGYKHDLFLSYSHAEAEWADSFRKALCKEFQVRAGVPVTVWQDSLNLRVGQKWASEIEEGVRNAAAFLAIVSPSYLNSPWCKQERSIVLANKLEALKIESFYRILKIIKTPGPGKAHEELLGTLQDIRFFNPADSYELSEGSPEFTAVVRAFVRHVRELLTLMSNKGQELYLAPGTIEALSERGVLEHEIKDRGFTIKPEVILDPDFGKGPIRHAMDRVSHVLFVFCDEFDEFTTDQVEVAQELGKPALFWIRPGPGQKAILDRIHDIGELPAGSEVLGGRSIREMIPPLLAKLKRKEAPEPEPPHSGAARVYINCDTTLPQESQLAAQIARVVRDRNFEAVQSGRDGGHERLMQISDAVLLFRAVRPDPDKWLREYAMELALAERIFGKEPNFARALLVSEPARIQAQAAGVPVYAYSEPFKPETLNLFFDKLRSSRTANAGQ